MKSKTLKLITTNSKSLSFFPLSSSLVLMFFFVLISCKNGDQVITPELKPITEAVYASGYIISGNEYQLYAQEEGTFLKKMVEEGEPVEPGQALFLLEGRQEADRLSLANEAFAIAQKNAGQNSPVIRETLAALETAKAKLTFDSTNNARYQNLLRENATTRVKAEEARLNYENSKNNYLSLRNKYINLKDQLSLELKNASNNLKFAQDVHKQYTITSKVKGTLFKTLKEPGELVRRGEPIAIIGQASHFYAQLKVDEQDIRRLARGQKVLLKIDAFPDQVFNGVVEKIYPYVDIRDQSIRVDATLEDTLPAGYSGLGLEANIIIRQKDNALVIPRKQLLPGDSVLVETDDGTKKVKIEKGVETLEQVEIISGLSKESKLVSK